MEREGLYEPLVYNFLETTQVKKKSRQGKMQHITGYNMHNKLQMYYFSFQI
jgi:hypothetical protein